MASTVLQGLHDRVTCLLGIRSALVAIIIFENLY